MHVVRDFTSSPWRARARKVLVTVASCCAAAGVTTGAEAAVIYVDDDAPRGGDGTSWATAFADLQDALAVAVAGDEIRIGQGTYKPAPPDGPRDVSFNIVSGVILQGGVRRDRRERSRRAGSQGIPGDPQRRSERR